MSRLIVISNRVSTPKPRSAEGAQGGLAVALAAALREYRGLWFGWSGEKTDEFTGQINLQRHDGVTTATIDLEEQDVDEYYNGYANRTCGRSSTTGSTWPNMTAASAAATSGSTSASPRRSRR